jgi:MFS family permease
VALHSAVFNLARVLGPAVAGLAIATIGLESAFLLNAASFGPVLVGLLLIRDQEMYAAPRRANAPMLAELGEGLAYAFRTPAVFQVVIVMAFLGTFGYNYRTMLPLLAPVAAVALLFGTIFTFTDMTVVYVLTRGGPFDTTQVLASLAFFKGIVGGNLSVGASISLLLFPVLLLAAVFVLRAARRTEVGW